MTSPRSSTARPPAVALMGPTASGKTELAMHLARGVDAEIVSVDSALVYRGMDIGTAKPDAAMRAAVPHHLIDIRDPHEPYSAAEFAADAWRAIDAIHARERLPLLVGGTGLYFRALLDGLSEIPASDPRIRAALADEAVHRGWPALHAELARVDPDAAARIRAGDRQRISRALEVFRASGRPISDWQREPGARRRDVRFLRIIVCPADRGELHARIARRFDLMLDAGFLDEVRELRHDARLHPELPSMRAVGYRQAWRHLDGATDAPQLREEAVAATRQLAKRQLTWLRRELAARWFDAATDVDRVAGAVEVFLGRQHR